MGNSIVRADAGRFPHRMAARIACAIRSAAFRGEGGPSPHPSPAALRAASAHEGLSPQPGSRRARGLRRPGSERRVPASDGDRDLSGTAPARARAGGRARDGLRRWSIRVLTLLLTGFVLVEVNRPGLSPQAQLATFALLGLPLCFLIRMKPDDPGWRRVLDLLGVAAAAASSGFVLYWSGFAGSTLGDRAGAESALDIAIGLVGVAGVLGATWRVIGPALPVLTGLFVLYAVVGPWLPEFLFPHRGYSFSRIASQGFLQSQGVFGIAMKVMFAYVFLFVVFGAVLQQTGAVRFITASARRLFLGTVGGAAKVSVAANAMMGSLSGSAVADAATTGTVTIPLMRSTGFTARAAAGITAAASSGAALVPPVMGAGAYMMLELVDPPVRYAEVIRAAILPAILYYAALIAMVHLHARRHPGTDPGRRGRGRGSRFAGSGGSGHRVRGGALRARGGAPRRAHGVPGGEPRARDRAADLALPPGDPSRPGAPGRRTRAHRRGGRPARGGRGVRRGDPRDGHASPGSGTRFPATVLSVAGDGILPALLLIMVGSVVLGMGLPSAVCYLLMAILIGPVIGQLGVPPLSVHFFIFYFGMMSMVTPPVALAAYTTAGIAGTPIIPAAFTAFRFALAGFALPYFFVFRPELLLIASERGLPGAVAAFGLGLAVVVLLAAGIVGWLFGPLGPAMRALALGAAALLLAPPAPDALLSLTNGVGLAAFAGFLIRARAGGRRSPQTG